jgi:Hpt domain
VAGSVPGTGRESRTEQMGNSMRVYEEHVTAISSGLVEVERASSPEQQLEIIESVFREAHSLKGAARAVNLVKIEATCPGQIRYTRRSRERARFPAPACVLSLRRRLTTARPARSRPEPIRDKIKKQKDGAPDFSSNTICRSLAHEFSPSRSAVHVRAGSFFLPNTSCPARRDISRAARNCVIKSPLG